MKFIDLFSGIGGFRSGLEMNGHECLAYAEIDKYARQSYKAIYNTNGEEEWEDVTKITDEEFRKYRGVADVIVGGFPCQAFSLAGKRMGFEDTRGTLFFEVARAIKEIQPSYALLENVKGLLSHDKGRTFGTIIQTLDELGYVTEWGLFNSKFWGVPQNRERIFILVTRKDVFTEPKLFKLLKQQKTTDSRLIDILEKEVDEKYYLDEKRIKNFKPSNRNVGHGLISILGNTSKTGYNRANVHDTVGITPTLAARDYKDPIQILVPSSKEAIRKLTPIECWRLQGFTDEQFYKAKNDGVSDSQLYKQAGNSVTVNVIDAIIKELLK